MKTNSKVLTPEIFTSVLNRIFKESKSPPHFLPFSINESEVWVEIFDAENKLVLACGKESWEAIKKHYEITP